MKINPFLSEFTEDSGLKVLNSAAAKDGNLLNRDSTNSTGP